MNATLAARSFLADAHIRYSAPYKRQTERRGRSGSLGAISTAWRAAAKPVQMQVELFGDETPGAVFEGTYIVLPASRLAYEEGGNEEE